MSNTEDIVPVIILNWNGEDDTIACLKSIRASEYAGFVPVLVVPEAVLLATRA